MKSTATKSVKKNRIQEGRISSSQEFKSKKSPCQIAFVDELKDIYFSEKALLDSIPMMIKQATSEDQIDSLVIHYNFTKSHLKRLECVFESIDELQLTKEFEEYCKKKKTLDQLQ